MLVFRMCKKTYDYVRYTAHKFDGYPEQTILLLAELISSGALELPEGTLSSSLTAEGLLRLPAVKGRSVTDGLLEMLHQSYDWNKERDNLNEIDVNNVSKLICICSISF